MRNYHLNRHHDDFGLAIDIIMESATVASDKGSTTLLVGSACVGRSSGPILTKSRVADSNEVSVGLR